MQLWQPRPPKKFEGPLNWLPSDENISNPQNPYGMSKIAEEMFALQLGKRYKIPTVAMRYSIVQGSRQSFYNAYSGACRIFSLAFHQGKEPQIYEDGNQVRDFVNIHDVVDANLLVLEDERADYEMFNVGGGAPVTVNQFASACAKIYDVKNDTWIKTSLQSRRTSAHTLTLLKDGKVIQVGGFSGGSSDNRVELYDPTNDKWLEGPVMNNARMLHTTSLLDDGRVMAIGGTSRAGNMTGTEIYNPETEIWSQSGDMIEPRVSHTATILEDGKVLVVGGTNMGSGICEIYDPKIGNWSASKFAIYQ